MDRSVGTAEQSSSQKITSNNSGTKGKKNVGFSTRLGDDRSLEQALNPVQGEDDVSRASSVPGGFEEAESLPLHYNRPKSSINELQLTESLNKLKNDSTPTVLRSALRKDVPSRDHSPGPLDLTGIYDLSKKMQAEHHARARATGLERDVASAPVSRNGSPKRHRRGLRDGYRTSSARIASLFQGRDDPAVQGHHQQLWGSLFHGSGAMTGQNTPDVEELEEYFPKPQKYRAGGLSTHLLGTWWNHGDGCSSSRSQSFSIESAPSSPGNTTPTERHDSLEDRCTPISAKLKHWSWGRAPKATDPDISSFVSAAASPTDLASPEAGAENRRMASKRPDYFTSSSTSSLIDLLNHPRRRRKSKDIDITIKKHVRETQTRKRYILKLCRSLMEYGAPTHRLEAYLSMTSRVLEIQAQFLYFPGTMIVAFDDPGTQTTEVKLVRVNQGVDLGRMKDSHSIYKDVSHDLISVEEGIQRLEEVSTKPGKFPTWFRILAFGVGSACVAPFAFGGRLIDLPVCFGLGLILGFLQLVVAPKSDLYASLFEIVATIITSFLSRLFGSLHHPGDPSQRIFCFSALAQSSIALILPGFTVLSAALELQSRSIVAGSVRIVFAIIYSLWIGYGLTLGTAIYGAFDRDADSNAKCMNPLTNDSERWVFLFVPLFTLCLAIINQAKWRQMPMMVLISFTGYEVNYWASTQFKGNTQVVSTLGAAAIGVLANGYSRFGRVIDDNYMKLEDWMRTTMNRGLFGRKIRQEASTEPQDCPRKPSIAESINRFLPKAWHSSHVHNGKGAEQSDSDLENGRAGIALDTMAPATNADGNKTDSTEVKSDCEDSVSKARSVNYVLAAAAMLPAIFVQVPSGIAVGGSLIDSIEAANSLNSNNNNYNNSTNSNGATLLPQIGGGAASSISFTVAATVIQAAIGITIGLFIGSVIVYPTGKGSSIGHGKTSRSGLFAF